MRKPFSITVVSVSFVLPHLACLAAIWLTFSWKQVALCAAVYFVRMFAVTEGFWWSPTGWVLSDART
jgi:hypothetical protein